MFRRNFIQLAAISTVAAPTSKTVTYHIEGFTCVTCAVGLDTMLRAEKGILQSKSSYPEKTAVIEFNPHLVTEVQIQAFIQDIGFTVKH